MSVSQELDKVKDLYSTNLREKGAVAAAVGWPTVESQQLRFEKLTGIITDRSQPVSVNDYGCGYGAHLTYLLRDAGVQVGEYNGYDLSESMLDAARAEHSNFAGALNLRCSSELDTVADYSFVSGTFNVRFASDEEAWAGFIRSTLDRLAACSRKGFAFNLLSTYVDWHAPNLYYADPGYWFDHCKRNYARRVTLLHDYPLYEWTMLVTKDAS